LDGPRQGKGTVRRLQRLREQAGRFQALAGQDPGMPPQEGIAMNPFHPESGPAVAINQDNRPAWATFVPLELLGPIDTLGGLGDLLGQEAEGKRPEDYLDDVVKLQQATARLRELAHALLAIEAPSPVEKSLTRARHDLGNRLNQVSGLVQLLQIHEE